VYVAPVVFNYIYILCKLLMQVGYNVIIHCGFRLTYVFEFYVNFCNRCCISTVCKIILNLIPLEILGTSCS